MQRESSAAEASDWRKKRLDAGRANEREDVSMMKAYDLSLSRLSEQCRIQNGRQDVLEVGKKQA